MVAHVPNLDLNNITGAAAVVACVWMFTGVLREGWKLLAPKFDSLTEEIKDVLSTVKELKSAMQGLNKTIEINSCKYENNCKYKGGKNGTT